ncbi:MAG: class II aldolase/adducin family protein [Bryobacteraceae bacterium]|nr:class II aldolase/adducin family protein [Bryobacteraceae bacterium]
MGASFYQRGYAFGSTGNLSIRDGDRIWISPTGRSLRDLRPDEFALVDANGTIQNARKPSKESPFHLAAYRVAAERAGAIVHLHSTYSVALSCLQDPVSALLPITPYFQMRVAPLAVVPYFVPGSPRLGDFVGDAARESNCMLLRNHGMTCIGRTMEEAVDRAEELEETAKLLFLLRGRDLQLLTQDDVGEIQRMFGS